MTTASSSVYVIDTHAFVWHLTSSVRLSSTAARLIEQGENGEHEMVLPTVVLAETIAIIEKRRMMLPWHLRYKGWILRWNSKTGSSQQRRGCMAP